MLYRVMIIALIIVVLFGFGGYFEGVITGISILTFYIFTIILGNGEKSCG